MRTRFARVFMVMIGVVILVMLLGIPVAAAGNGNGGGTGNVGGDSQQQLWQRGEAAGSRFQSGDCDGTGEGYPEKNRWQQNTAKGHRQQSGSCTCSALTAVNNPLNQEEEDWLVYMREEEKLARDVYQILYNEWGGLIFNNIAASEQKHMDAVLKMLDKYGINDPAEGKGIGEFTNSDLQNLYNGYSEAVKELSGFNNLTDWGLSSVEAAYKVGVFIEETDIEDLNSAIAVSGAHPDIIRVYTNLLDGSKNHLAAFESYITD